MSSCFIFGPNFEFLEVCEHFTLLPHGEDPGVPREIVDKGDVVSTSSMLEMEAVSSEA